MEWYEYLKEKWHLDVVIVALVFLSGFFQEKYLRTPWRKDPRFDASLKTLVISLLISSIYIMVSYKEAKRMDAETLIPWAKYLFSWFAATSLYDMCIRPLRKWIKKKTGDTDDSPISTPGEIQAQDRPVGKP